MKGQSRSTKDEERRRLEDDRLRCGGIKGFQTLERRKGLIDPKEEGFDRVVMRSKGGEEGFWEEVSCGKGEMKKRRGDIGEG